MKYKARRGLVLEEYLGPNLSIGGDKAIIFTERDPERSYDECAPMDAKF